METSEGIVPGQRHNGIAAPYLIEYVDMEALLAAKGFDNNRPRALLRETETHTTESGSQGQHAL